MISSCFLFLSNLIKCNKKVLESSNTEEDEELLQIVQGKARSNWITVTKGKFKVTVRCVRKWNILAGSKTFKTRAEHTRI